MNIVADLKRHVDMLKPLSTRNAATSGTVASRAVPQATQATKASAALHATPSVTATQSLQLTPTVPVQPTPSMAKFQQSSLPVSLPVSLATTLPQPLLNKLAQSSAAPPSGAPLISAVFPSKPVAANKSEFTVKPTVVERLPPYGKRSDVEQTHFSAKRARSGSYSSRSNDSRDRSHDSRDSRHKREQKSHHASKYHDDDDGDAYDSRRDPERDLLREDRYDRADHDRSHDRDIHEDTHKQNGQNGQKDKKSKKDSAPPTAEQKKAKTRKIITWVIVGLIVVALIVMIALIVSAVQKKKKRQLEQKKALEAAEQSRIIEPIHEFKYKLISPPRQSAFGRASTNLDNNKSAVVQNLDLDNLDTPASPQVRRTAEEKYQKQADDLKQPSQKETLVAPPPAVAVASSSFTNSTTTASASMQALRQQSEQAEARRNLEEKRKAVASQQVSQQASQQSTVQPASETRLNDPRFTPLAKLNASSEATAE